MAAELAQSTDALKSELWARLAAASLSVPSVTLQRLSVVYAYCALGVSRCIVPYKIPFSKEYRQQLWSGIAHVLLALALLTTDATR